MATAKDAAVDDVADAPHPLTIEEFMVLLSKRDRRVELTHAFYDAQRRAGKAKDTAANYQAAFDAFVNLPA